MNPLGSSFNAAAPPPPAKLQTTNHMTSFGIIPLLECFFKNTTVVKLYSMGKYFFNVYLSYLVDSVTFTYKNNVRSSGRSRRGARGAGHPLIFRTNWGSKGRKKFFWDQASPLSQGLDDQSPPTLSGGLDPPLRSRFRSIPLHTVPRRQSTWYASAYRKFILDLISRSLQYVSYWMEFFPRTD